jgi:ACS family hexuronate transporter-like MFS transporter
MLERGLGAVCTRATVAAATTKREGMNETIDYGASCITSRRGADSLALSLMLFMAMNAITMSQMPVVTKELQDKFSFSGGEIGLLTSAFMVAFAIGAIPMGLAAARWGGCTVLAGAGVLMLGSIMFAFSSSYPLFLVARFLQGVGGATVLPVANPLMAQSISSRFHARCMGVFGSGWGLGVVLGLLILPSVDKAGGYRAVFLVSAAIAVVIALVGLAQKPVRARPDHPEGVPSFRSLTGGVAAVATNRRVLLLCVINIGVSAIVSGLLAWTPSFLHDQRGASLAVAAYLSAGIGVAQLIGNPVGAASMAKWGKPFVLLVSLAVMFVVTALVPAGPGLVLPFVCVTIGGFLTMTVFPAIFGSVPDIVARPEQIGVATGFVSLSNLVGTLFAPWIFGVLLDAYGKGSGTHGYLWGYLLLALFPLLGTIAAVIYAATARKRPLASVLTR